MRSKWFTVVQSIIGLVIVALVARSVIGDWDRVRASGIAFTFRPGWLLLSLLLTWVGYAGLIEGWRRMVTGWGVALRWPLAGRIWILASFGKYLPGKLWAIAGMAVLSERAGVNGKVTTAAAIVMQVLAIGTGLAVAALAIGPAIKAWNPDAGMAMTLLGVVVLGALAAVASRRVITTLWTLARREGPAPAPPRKRELVLGAVVNVVAWLVYGAALVALAHGVLPEPVLGFREATGAFAFAYLAGYLTPIAPGGLGVRDALLAWLLEPWLGIGPALALVAASRLMLTLNELGAAAPFLFLRGSARDHA